ncbi:membrane protein [Streptococcus criceti]|uniref:DUF1146 domain-containing protein n=1 Tax=Streptococcus criceti HS-6 TaxID=873449 RepID=G5JQL3_STRCG|nr:DUF1146 family protein [Streptococcus criceti]EHI74518.1 hypothetical protein STRCR_1815 [Streptococcus criceti HS-6]SUN43081.1 membrane protein [Streptococcus criceti]
MEILQSLITIICHLFFILMSFQLLTRLVNWEKILRLNPDNFRQINLLVMFLAIGLGFLVSSFFLSVISLAMTIFTTVH